MPAIARNFWRKNVSNRKALSDDDISALAAYDWPGNVRELHNVLERAALFPDRAVADLVAEEEKKCASLRRDASGGGQGTGVECTESRESPVAGAAERVSSKDKSENLDDAIRDHVREVVARHGGNRTEAARALGISRGTLRTYLKG